MTKERILVVEDDEDILQLLTFTFESAGFEVRTATTGREGLDIALRQKPALVLLDLMLPGMSGLDVCRELKRLPETEDVPVIMLTARGEEVDRIVGLELGADDYVVKPFSPRELVLRIRAVLKRAQGVAENPQRSQWQIDGLALDLDAHRVEVDGEEAALTATEFRLLAELVRNRGRVRTRDQLLNTVWGYEFEGYARTVDTHVRRLRQKIGDYAAMIETIRGVGYRFKEQ
ncbi:response regulator transcription factor [Nitratidesulfovibrio sp. 1201_IL3209]|jgi:two-component system phosphate regulon response regulator PhoB|uniref:response regulator transcription factor n=1 Tax=Nitratidesulfovibrio sp. 1201_IL3209 TaxID=3084053 RepID=UPI002FDA7D78